MTQGLAIINLVCAFLSWKWATESFSHGHNLAGWLNVVASAVNAACFANIVL